MWEFFGWVLIIGASAIVFGFVGMLLYALYRDVKKRF